MDLAKKAEGPSVADRAGLL